MAFWLPVRCKGMESTPGEEGATTGEYGQSRKFRTWSQNWFIGSLGAAKGEKCYMFTRYYNHKRGGGGGGQKEQNRTERMLNHRNNKLTHNDSSSVGALLACLSVNAKQFFSLWPAFVQI